MTDISKIADAIMALINSSPRSPRKDEIEAVLAHHIKPGTGDTPSSGYAGVATGGWVSIPPPSDCGNIFTVFTDTYAVQRDVMVDTSPEGGFEPISQPDGVFEPISQADLAKLCDQLCQAEDVIPAERAAWEAQCKKYAELMGYEEKGDDLALVAEAPVVHQHGPISQETFTKAVSLIGDPNINQDMLAKSIARAEANIAEKIAGLSAVETTATAIAARRDQIVACKEAGHEWGTQTESCTRCGSTLMEAMKAHFRLKI